MKKLLLSWVSAFALCFSIASSASANSGEEAVAVVKDSVSVVLADLKKNRARYKTDSNALNQLINQKILPYFDERAMAIKVLGPNWRKATKQQQNDFIKEFRQLVLRTYSKNLLDYADATVDFGDAEITHNGRIASVDATVRNSDGKVYPLVLMLLQKKGQWKIIDVSMEGLSLITIYQGALAEEVADKGLQGIIDEYRVMNRSGRTLKQ